MNKIIIMPKIYVAFEDKDTDQILIQDFDKEISLERRTYYTKISQAGSLLIKYGGQTFFIDKEDIFYLLCVSFPMMYIDVCNGKAIRHDLQEREGYAVHMDPNIQENFIVLTEFDETWETPYPPYKIVQSIVLPMEDFLRQLLDVLTDFAHHYFRIKQNEEIPDFYINLINDAKFSFENLYRISSKEGV